MSLSNYIDLINALQQWLAHDDVTAQLDNFVKLAESRFNREIRTIEMVTRGFTDQVIPIDTSLNVGKIALPTGYLEIVSHHFGASGRNTVPEYRPPNEFFGLIATRTGGIPRIYTLVGEEMFFASSPAETSLYQMFMTTKLDPLTPVQNNWLMQKAPDVYLYGCLLESAPFLLDDGRLAVWQQLYDRGLISLLAQDSRARYRPGGRIRAPLTTGMETTRQF